MNIIDCIGNTPLIKEAEEKKLLTKDKIILEPTSKLANQIYDEEPEKYFIPNQFDNSSNIKAHYETTEKKILEQTKGEITHFVAGMGTTGTLMGVSKRLKEYNKDIKIIGVEPLPGHRI